MPRDEVWGAEGVHANFDPNAGLAAMRRQNYSASDKRKAYWPKGKDGKPKDVKDLTEYETALVSFKGNASKAAKYVKEVKKRRNK